MPLREVFELFYTRISVLKLKDLFGWAQINYIIVAASTYAHAGSLMNNTHWILVQRLDLVVVSSACVRPTM